MKKIKKEGKMKDIPFVVKVLLTDKTRRGYASYLVIAPDDEDAKGFMQRKLEESKMVENGISFKITSCREVQVDQMLISDSIK